MGIANKATYGEYYWAMQVEASAKFDEDMEKAFAPFFSALLADIPSIIELPAGMQTFIRALAEPPSAGFGGFALGVGVETIDELLSAAMGPMMAIAKRALNRAARETWLTAEQAHKLFQRGKIDEPLWADIIASEGYEDITGKFAYYASLPYPAISDVMLWARYTGDPNNTQPTVWEKLDVPAEDYAMYEWLTFQRLTIQDAHTLFRRGKFSEPDLVDELRRIGWQRQDLAGVIETGWSLPNALLMVQGGLQQKAEHDKIIADISRADIHPEFAELYYDAILTKPASSDIINYELRRDPNLSVLSDRLRKIGIHPEYWDLYKELAYVIPPVADIITMAVREAFTPEIATRFGQYEDFPAPLAEWAGKKGLSKEWAERYWASHWALPSAGQGFDMLHRGIIDVDELKMLLRALDVMPFWRDKLIQVAYRPLTRVDVRRMYKEGVLDEAGVYSAYLDHGYSEKNAEAMTEFTVKYTLSQAAKFSSTDVVSAYAKRMVDRSTAASLLRDLGIKSEDVSYILTRADYKRQWDLTDEKIKGIKNLYKKGVYTENEARDALSKLALPADQINVLFEQWFYEKRGELAPTWTRAETLKFIENKFITAERGITELRRMGYDDEHINVYMRSLT